MFNSGGAWAILKGMFSSGYRTLGSFITGLSAFFAPISVAVVAVLGFILYDAIKGYAVGKKYGYTKVESGKIWKTLRKMLEAVMLIVGAFVIDTHIVASVNLHLVEFVAGAICFTEFWSLLESWCELNEDSRVAQILLKVVKAKGSKYFDIEISEEDVKKPKPRRKRKTKKDECPIVH